MFGYDNLQNYFRTNFTLMHDYHYSLSEIEGMIPWEKTLYIDMLNQRIKYEEEMRKHRENQMKAQRKANR